MATGDTAAHGYNSSQSERDRERELEIRLTLATTAMSNGWDITMTKRAVTELADVILDRTPNAAAGNSDTPSVQWDQPTAACGATAVPEATPDRRKPRPVLLSQMTARIAEQLVRAARDRGEKYGDLALLHNQAVRELAEAGA